MTLLAECGLSAPVKANVALDDRTVDAGAEVIVNDGAVTSTGVTGLLGLDAAPVPASLVAVTLNA